jgi:hypothetical protein
VKPLFALDTSLFLNGWTKFYVPTVFPAVWSAIEHALREGAATACWDVYDEIRHKEDEIAKWAKERQEFFQPPSEQCLLKLREVMAEFPAYVRAGGAKNKADPMIVAHAIVTDTTVVTFEQPQPIWNPKRAPKLPFACDRFGVHWMSPCSFFEAIGLHLK